MFFCFVQSYILHGKMVQKPFILRQIAVCFIGFDNVSHNWAQHASKCTGQLFVENITVFLIIIIEVSLQPEVNSGKRGDRHRIAVYLTINIQRSYPLHWSSCREFFSFNYMYVRLVHTMNWNNENRQYAVTRKPRDSIENWFGFAFSATDSLLHQFPRQMLFELLN